MFVHILENGAAFQGGYIEAYVPGTNDRKILYSDYELTVSLPTRILSDANGRVEFYGAGVLEIRAFKPNSYPVTPQTLGRQLWAATFDIPGTNIPNWTLNLANVGYFTTQPFCRAAGKVYVLSGNNATEDPTAADQTSWETISESFIPEWTEENASLFGAAQPFTRVGGGLYFFCGSNPEVDPRLTGNADWCQLSRENVVEVTNNKGAAANIALSANAVPVFTTSIEDPHTVRQFVLDIGINFPILPPQPVTLYATLSERSTDPASAISATVLALTTTVDAERVVRTEWIQRGRQPGTERGNASDRETEVLNHQTLSLPTASIGAISLGATIQQTNAQGEVIAAGTVVRLYTSGVNTRIVVERQNVGTGEVTYTQAELTTGGAHFDPVPAHSNNQYYNAVPHAITPTSRPLFFPANGNLRFVAVVEDDNATRIQEHTMGPTGLISDKFVIDTNDIVEYLGDEDPTPLILTIHARLASGATTAQVTYSSIIKS